MGQVGAIDKEVGVDVAGGAGDAQADLGVGVLLLRRELGQQVFGTGHLGLALAERRGPGLPFRQLLQRTNLELDHGSISFFTGDRRHQVARAHPNPWFTLPGSGWAYFVLLCGRPFY